MALEAALEEVALEEDQVSLPMWSMNQIAIREGEAQVEKVVMAAMGVTELQGATIAPLELGEAMVESQEEMEPVLTQVPAQVVMEAEQG